MAHIARTRLFLGLMLTSIMAIHSHAGMVSASFSGAWSTNIGVIHSNDPFNGIATWNDLGVNTSLISVAFTMPAATGLSVPGIFSSNLAATEVFYTNGAFSSLQLNIVSPTDGQGYGFFFNPSGAIALTGSPIMSTSAQGYAFSGPASTSAPEVPTFFISAAACALLGLRLKTRVRAGEPKTQGA